jgi:glycosyltransferase involved in cell wall biosynthesis
VRSVLLLAHRFPPLGGAAVQRNVQLARYLAATGYRPIVVTGPGAHDDPRWMPRDAALVDRRLPCIVHRVQGEEPTLATSRAGRWLRVPPQWQRWWSAAALEAVLAVGADADLLHVSLAPFSAGDAALALARKLDKPLVVDLEDPWALDDMQSYTSVVHRRLELRVMRRVLRAADTIVMNTPEARLRILQVFPELAPDRVAAIPNSFDPLDFAAPAPEPRHDGRFRIAHTGTLHTDLGLQQRTWRGRVRRLLGGAAHGVDFLARSHAYLLKAVDEAIRRRPELDGVIEVHLAGVFTSEDRAVGSRYPFVRMHEFLPHDETIALMRSADLLFLPLYDLPPGRRAGIVPHKTYEYIGSRRPILGAVPDGDARDLLARSGAAVLCRPADTGAMADLLLADVDCWASGLPPRSPRAEVVAECSAQRLVTDLARAYDELLEDAHGPRERARDDAAPRGPNVRAPARGT